MGAMRQTHDRFWSKVDLSEVGPLDCWIWAGARTSRGYGSISRKGFQCRAHRAAYALTYGSVPSGMVVRHRCDNPLCVNPLHLVSGTQSENMLEAFARGLKRPAIGSRVGSSKLTDGQARSIMLDDRRHREIASDFGVSESAIGHIKNGRTWGHLFAEGGKFGEAGE